MARWRLWKRAGLLALLALVLEGCATGGRWLQLRPSSPHEQYVKMLERTGRADAAEAANWIDASEAVLGTARPTALPQHVVNTITAGEAGAAAFTVRVAEGRRLTAELRAQVSAPGPLFLDVFASDDDTADDQDPSAVAAVRPEALERVASLAPDALTVGLDVRRATSYVIRVHPSLEWAGTYVLTLRTQASLPFPVEGLSARAVQSGFGVARDAGRREHEGIDIFAPRGTPVLAVVNGIAQPSSNGLGGTVVWLHEPGGGRTFYYAHLDRQAFTEPRRVAIGDVLGYVGNTGNARTTAPHLHFGLYDDGPRDPLPYVQPDDVVPPLPRLPTVATQ
jgi:peptidoglycan LD-endopeptidase LytH